MNNVGRWTTIQIKYGRLGECATAKAEGTPEELAVFVAELQKHAPMVKVYFNEQNFTDKDRLADSIREILSEQANGCDYT